MSVRMYEMITHSPCTQGCITVLQLSVADLSINCICVKMQAFLMMHHAM